MLDVNHQYFMICWAFIALFFAACTQHDPYEVRGKVVEGFTINEITPTNDGGYKVSYQFINPFDEQLCIKTILQENKKILDEVVFPKWESRNGDLIKPRPLREVFGEIYYAEEPPRPPVTIIKVKPNDGWQGEIQTEYLPRYWEVSPGQEVYFVPHIEENAGGVIDIYLCNSLLSSAEVPSIGNQTQTAQRYGPLVF